MVAPVDVATTSRAGQGRLYDYIVCSEGALDCFGALAWEDESTWLAHKGLRHPLRSKGAPLPSLKELDAILDRPEVGKRGVTWDDPWGRL